MAIQLLELEKELSGPDRHTLMEQHDAVLAALDRRIGEAMEAGLSPDEFQRAEQLRSANLTARKLLRLAVMDADASASHSRP